MSNNLTEYAQRYKQRRVLPRFVRKYNKPPVTEAQRALYIVFCDDPFI